ncbi:MAG: DUF4956 domain-containing protein [Myxococcales bacterium]|nr:DUF4956 domain-containing protein [Myxococcales bacterium]MCH7866669.1 DUF4956 domain-containing protein [Myxococcales bacterium]
MNTDVLFGQMEQTISGGSWVAPLTALVSAFVFGQVLAWTYERTYSGLSYSRGFSHTLVLVCISASILVLSMKYSLIAGLGLFGVLSMIRFRTDLKTPRDLVFVMGAACIGVACGVGAMIEAFMGASAFALVALYLFLGPFGSRSRFDGVLRFQLPTQLDSDTSLAQLMRLHCRRLHLLSTADIEEGTQIEHVYQVKFFRERDREDLLAALRQDLGALETRLMLQDASSEY